MVGFMVMVPEPFKSPSALVPEPHRALRRRGNDQDRVARGMPVLFQGQRPGNIGRTLGAWMGRAYSPWVVHDREKTLGGTQGWDNAAPVVLGSERANNVK